MKTRTHLWIILVAMVCCAGPVSAQAIERISVSTAGVEGNGESRFPTVSADGRYVAFQSTATNLVPNDTKGFADVFLRDRVAVTTQRLSVSSTGAEADGHSGYPSVTATGLFVAFDSDATNLVLLDTNDRSDVFLRDVVAGATTRVSISSAGVGGNHDSEYPSISADGQVIAFESTSSNLVFGDTNGIRDIFVHNRAAGTTVRVSVSSTGAEANSSSRNAAVSADGRWVAFESRASNLVIGDTNGRQDIFVHDLQTTATTRVSVSASGAEANTDCSLPSISSDGQLIAFSSPATTLSPDGGGVLIKDRVTGSVARVDVATYGDFGDRAGVRASVSGDGQIVGFESWASNLTRGGMLGTQLPYVHSRAAGATTRVAVSATAEISNGLSEWPVVTQDGIWVAFADTGSNLVSGDTNGTYDVFIRALSAPDWVTFGSGLMGTHWVPSIDIDGAPVLGQTFRLTATNSRGTATNVAVFLGIAPTAAPVLGGTLWVNPRMVLGAPIPSGGLSLPIPVPNRTSLLWGALFFQVLEEDPGAIWGVSFTPGLALVLGK